MRECGAAKRDVGFKTRSDIGRELIEVDSEHMVEHSSQPPLSPHQRSPGKTIHIQRGLGRYFPNAGLDPHLFIGRLLAIGEHSVDDGNILVREIEHMRHSIDRRTRIRNRVGRTEVRPLRPCSAVAGSTSSITSIITSFITTTTTIIIINVGDRGGG